MVTLVPVVSVVVIVIVVVSGQAGDGMNPEAWDREILNVQKKLSMINEAKPGCRGKALAIFDKVARKWTAGQC